MPINRRVTLAAFVFGIALSAGALHAQSRNDLNSLVQQGEDALDRQRFGDALDAFTRASKLAPRDPSLCLGAGIAAMRMGRNDEAEDWFEQALKLAPGFTNASEWLGELQYREGRVKEAIATFEAAVKLAPKDADLEKRLGEWRKETQLQDRFYESRGAHFVVLFEGPADESLARRVVEMLEQSYWRIGGVLTISCGLMIWASKAEFYYHNPYLWAKFSLLTLVGVHALVFRSVYSKPEALDAAPQVPVKAKVAAWISLLLWLGLVTAGRLIGYWDVPDRLRPKY